MQDAVGSRWYYYVRERGDLINIGTVQIRFYVRSDGKVEDVKVLRNSSNETLASTSLQSIIEANYTTDARRSCSDVLRRPDGVYDEL